MSDYKRLIMLTNDELKLLDFAIKYRRLTLEESRERLVNYNGKHGVLPIDELLKTNEELREETKAIEKKICRILY